MEKQISELTDHYIICGYGRIGSIISLELADENIPFVVIEQASAKIEQLKKARPATPRGELPILDLQPEALSDAAKTYTHAFLF